LVDGVEALLLRSLMEEPFLDLPFGELLDSVAKRRGPGAGAIAALTAASAAALVELAARATGAEAWPEAAGAAAQARKLRDRLVPLAHEDAEAYQTAVAKLEERDQQSAEPGAAGARRDFALGTALARAADVPLEIADHAENVAALAAEAAARATPDLRPDAAAAAALALGAAWAAAKLVEVNLAMRADDPRLARARQIAAGATETAQAALTADEIT
jgi:formiminotetrahydrofolate cyclodeaminase